VGVRIVHRRHVPRPPSCLSLLALLLGRYFWPPLGNNRESRPAAPWQARRGLLCTRSACVPPTIGWACPISAHLTSALLHAPLTAATQMFTTSPAPCALRLNRLVPNPHMAQCGHQHGQAQHPSTLAQRAPKPACAAQAVSRQLKHASASTATLPSVGYAVACRGGLGGAVHMLAALSALHAYAPGLTDCGQRRSAWLSIHRCARQRMHAARRARREPGHRCPTCAPPC
jgi:hypothetical protein